MTRSRKGAELLTAYESGGYPHFKNRIINGAFQIWQRGTTISSIAATGVSPTYVADRWCLFPANTGWTAVAQAVQVSGGGLRVNCTTAAAYTNSSDVFSLQQRIEGLNCYDLAGQQVTVSFKVKTNKTGNYGVTLYAADTSTWGTPQSITVSASGVETLYTLTFTAQSGITASTTEGLRLVITLGANTNRAGVYYPTGGSQVNLLDSTSNYFEIREVQLEKGSTATSFDYRPYGTELALCQRYYCKSYSLTTVPGTNAASGFSVTVTNGGVGWANFDFPSEMRTVPTMASYSYDGSVGYLYIGVSNQAASVASVSTRRGSITSSAPSNGTWAYGHFTATAEL